MPKARKKAQKAKLPKTIAGVRVGKELRSAIEPVFRFARHPMVNDALAAALVAGADALLTGKKGRQVSGAAVGAAISDMKKRAEGGPIGLTLAVAAGEIASHIVAAYATAPKAEKRSARKPESDTPKARSKDLRRRK